MIVKHLGIRAKLLIVFVLTLGLALFSMLLFIEWSFRADFSAYVEQQALDKMASIETDLWSYYVENGNWERLRRNNPAWNAITRPRRGEDRLNIRRGRDDFFGRSRGRDRSQNHPRGRGRPAQSDRDRQLMSPQADNNRADGESFRSPPGNRNQPRRQPPHGRLRGDPGPEIYLLDANKAHIVGRFPRNLDEATLKPLYFEHVLVGYLGINLPDRLPEELDQVFLAQQSRSFQFITAAIFLFSLLIVLPLSSHLVKPIKLLAKKMQSLTAGDFKTRIDHNATDEIGRLSSDFNQLAITLQANENARRQWFADISHELRTPLSVLKGQIEAIQDGVRTANPESLLLLSKKIAELNCLIDDLFELSLADLGALDYQKERFLISDLTEELVDSFSELAKQRRIDLQCQMNGLEEILLYADYKRLIQLFSNLLKNSLRYTDPGGKIIFAIQQDDKMTHFVVEDTKPGVSDEALALLFERLYRVESSRNRDRGGAGLGLAISKTVVEAHQGHITAEHSDLGGLKVTISLPNRI